MIRYKPMAYLKIFGKTRIAMPKIIAKRAEIVIDIATMFY